MTGIAVLNQFKGLRVPSMARTNAIAMDFVAAGANFTASFWWLPDQARMVMRVAGDQGSLYFGNANIADTRPIRGAIHGARTNTDLAIVLLPTVKGMPFTPANADRFLLGVGVGRF